MTVACALHDHDALFLASDSSVGGLPTKALTSKLEIFEDQRAFLAFAGAGYEAISDQTADALRQFLSRPRSAPVTWDDFVVTCVKSLATFNGLRVEAARLSRTSFNPEADLTAMPLAGFIDCRPEILHVAQNGEWTLHIKANRIFSAIDGGKHHAAMAYEILRDHNLLPTSGHEALRVVTELPARHAPNCEPPASIAEITSAGVRLL